MTLPSTPREFSVEELYASPGDLTLLGLAVAARGVTLDGLSRGVPELTASGYDSAHVALVEAFAALTAQVAYRAERVPLVVLASAFELLGLPRRGATPAVVDVFVDNPSSQDVFWVEGSMVGAGRTVFEVTSTVLVPAGAVAYGPVALSCLERGPTGNVQARWPSWSLVTTVPLTNILNPQPGQGGANAETDNEYVRRAGGRFAARRIGGDSETAWGMGSREADILVLAEDTPGIQRALVVPHARLSAGARWSQFPWSGGDWGGPVYEQREGSVSVVARPYGGGYLSTQLLGRLGTVMGRAEAAGVRIGVTSCEEVPVDLAVRVRVEATADLEAVRAAVQKSLTSWLSPLTWPWAGPLTRPEVAAQAAKIAGVRSVYVQGMTPAAEREDSVTVTRDSENLIVGLTPLYPHVLLAARGVTVEATRV